MRISSITGRGPPSRRAGGPAPRQPCTGRSNLSTSRSVKTPPESRARRTGWPERSTSTRAPGGSVTARRPSHHSTAAASESASSCTARCDCGPTTTGRAKRACALIGHEEQRLDVGPDHRPARRERVRRRPRGRGHDDAVTAPRRQRTAVDLGGELEHPLARGLLDGDLVERPRGEHRVAVAPGPHLEGHPLLDRVVAGADPLDGGVEVLLLRLGEEADVAEVHPQQGGPGARGRARRPAGSCRRRRARRRARSRGRGSSRRRRPRRGPPPAACRRGRRPGRRRRCPRRAGGWPRRRRAPGRRRARRGSTSRTRRAGVLTMVLPVSPR